jgi:hypothetical protein
MEKINSTLSSVLLLLAFIICIAFTGQSQTLSATSGSIHFENYNHVVNGISVSLDVTGFLSVCIENIGGESEIGSLRMTGSSLRFSPLNLYTSTVRPWIGAGVCYSTFTPGVALTRDFADNSSKSDLTLNKQTGITVPISAGLDIQLSERFSTSIAVTSHMGESSTFENPQVVYGAKTVRTDALIGALQMGLAFRIIKTITRKNAESNYNDAEKIRTSIDLLEPVLFVDTKGSVVSEDEWNQIFPELGDPDSYTIDHAIIISEYSKADYKKMIKASEKNSEMYEKDAVKSVNASILYHILHDKKQDKESKKKDR